MATSWRLEDLLNTLLGSTAMIPGASSVTANGPFVKYGVMPPAPAEQGPLSALFPDGATPTQQPFLSPGMTKGLNALSPLLVGAGLVAANSFGTGQPQAAPGLRGGTIQFARPSDAFYKLMLAEQRRQRW